MVLKYQQPFAQTDQATDGWGSWADGRTQAHRGVDYQPGAGASIPAVATGTVSYNGWNSALGNVLVIAHPDGMYSGYSHMRDRSPHALGTGITRGQHVGYVGNTGTASRAAHLHLTITHTADGTWNNGDINVTVDPYAFINARLNGDDPITAPPKPKEDDMIRLARIPINGANESAGVHWIVIDHGARAYWNVKSMPAVDLLRAQGIIEIPDLQAPSIVGTYRNITNLT
ncbi:M23 family metallopeptidase [Plantibacter sp. ME-Dv--P-122b]|uniref:M23 family metallopeptidase n=1 Tax=Plantibacter sp. ME-Dv--P-122b TaxID=3040300 RepID=UPI00254DF32F|nr:M23 family metallopeptidase [Plantibacter sp. ME-Dv--P-122b]